MKTFSIDYRFETRGRIEIEAETKEAAIAEMCGLEHDELLGTSAQFEPTLTVEGVKEHA